jgi:hypothetical protein
MDTNCKEIDRLCALIIKFGKRLAVLVDNDVWIFDLYKGIIAIFIHKANLALVE